LDPTTVTAVKNGVVAEWESIRIEVFNIQPRRMGAVAEISLYSHGYLLDYCIQNIIDTQKTNNLVRKMSSLNKTPHWASMITTALLLAKKAFDDQNPIQKIEDLLLLKQSFRWVARPFLAENLPTILFGPGGTGKSKFAVWLSCMLQNGIEADPWLKIKQAWNVLYLDWESDEEEMGYFCGGLRQANPEFIELPLYRRCEQPITSEAVNLSKMIASNKVDIIIIDSLALACGGDPVSPESAFTFFRTIRFLGCHALILAHPPKYTEQGKMADVFGSAFFQNLTRSVWEMQRVNEGSHHIGLFHRKCNYSQLFRPLGWEIKYSYDPWSVELAYKDLWGTDLEARLPLGDRIEHLLGEAPNMTTKEITEGLGMDTKKWKIVFAALTKDSRFDCTGKGKPEDETWFL